MAYKSILLHVEERAENRIRLAVHLARQHNAVLIGIAAGMWQPPLAVSGLDLGALSAEIIEAGREQVETDLKKAGMKFQTMTEKSGIRTEWRSVADFPFAALCKAANAADVIVSGSLETYLFGAEYRSVNPGDVLMGAGRPLLVVPDQITTLKATNIVAAWKNTREARRALADALPFMSIAESVVLIQVRENGADDASIADAKAFLVRHGVDVRVDIRDLKAPTIEEELMQSARACGADLIVSGAYGRSRLREWVFGGVTRGLLKQHSIVCQLSH